MSKFVIEKKIFVDNFLTPLSRFDLPDKSAQVILDNGQLTGVTYNQHRHIIHRNVIKDVKGDGFDPVIYRDIPKLISALGFVKEELLTLDVDKTFMLYSDDLIRFKQYFMDSRYFNDQVSNQLVRINDLSFDKTFVISPTNCSNIRKSKQFSPDSKVVYFEGVSGKIFACRENANTKVDDIRFKICDSFEGGDFSPLAMDINIFDLISEKIESILVKVNTQFNLFMLEIENEKYKQEYITSTIKT